MKHGFMLNPIEEFVNEIKRRIKDNNGYCIEADEKTKQNKCPKYCKNMSDCPCGLYIQSNHRVDSE